MFRSSAGCEEPPVDRDILTPVDRGFKSLGDGPDVIVHRWTLTFRHRWTVASKLAEMARQGLARLGNVTGRLWALSPVDRDSVLGLLGLKCWPVDRGWEWPVDRGLKVPRMVPNSRPLKLASILG